MGLRLSLGILLLLLLLVMLVLLRLNSLLLSLEMGLKKLVLVVHLLLIDHVVKIDGGSLVPDNLLIGQLGSCSCRILASTRLRGIYRRTRLLRLVAGELLDWGRWLSLAIA